MYIVMYSFKVKANKEEAFLESWRALTKLIYKYEKSLGSRLHKNEPLLYIAYAQWPSKEVFEKAGKNLPEESNACREAMKDSCETIQVLDKFEVIEDLLMQKQHD